MTESIWVTSRIHARTKEKAGEFAVTQEGLAGVLLLLGLSNETTLKQALDLMRMYDLGGAENMEKKGW